MAQKSKTQSNHETLALVLLISGLAGFFLFLWQVTYLPKNLIGYLNLSFSLFDFYLAFAFFKNKPKLKKTFFLRIFLGLICWLAIFNLGIEYGLIWAKIGFLATLATIGTGKAKKASLLAIFAVICLILNSYFTVYYITNQQKLSISLRQYGANSFISQKYNYKLTTPSNWKIVQRKDLAQIRKKFLKTEAEIALFTKEGNSFCLIIPSKLDKFKKNYPLARIKKMLIDNFKIRKTVKINKVAPFISAKKGFQIQYTDIIEGFRQDYIIIYLNKDNLAIKLIGWTLGNDQEKIYKEIKSIAKNITINKK